jgi:hypothetical protein
VHLNELSGRLGEFHLRPNVEARQDAAKRFLERMRPVFEGFELRGLSQRQMVVELNALGVRAPRGGMWALRQVQRLRARLPRA